MGDSTEPMLLWPHFCPALPAGTCTPGQASPCSQLRTPPGSSQPSGFGNATVARRGRCWGKQWEAPSSQLLHPCQDSGTKDGERKRFYAGRGKGKHGRAALAFVLQVQPLQCQAGPCPRLRMWLQSVTPRKRGCRAGCLSKDTFSGMPAWAKRYDP